MSRLSWYTAYLRSGKNDLQALGLDEAERIARETWGEDVCYVMKRPLTRGGSKVERAPRAPLLIPAERYRLGIQWIAENDEPGDRKLESVSEMISTMLLADLAGLSYAQVAAAIIRYRRKEKIK